MVVGAKRELMFQEGKATRWSRRPTEALHFKQ